MSLFPHHNLDWNLTRLERSLPTAGDDWTVPLQYAQVAYARAAFHDGGETWFNQALTRARDALRQKPDDIAALALSAAALIGLERLDLAKRQLDKRIAIDRSPTALDHYAVGLWHAARYADTKDRRWLKSASDELERACRLDPDAWEPHAQLARVFRDHARASNASKGTRLLERSMYHAVRAIELEPVPHVARELQHRLGEACFHTGRFEQACRALGAFVEQDGPMSDQARFMLGLSNHQLGRYKKALLYLHKAADRAPENAEIFAHIAAAHLELGELAKARQAGNRSLAIDPHCILARWTLGRVRASEGELDAALRELRDVLADSPEHLPAFAEIVRIRAEQSETEWLINALQTEVSAYDRHPVRRKAKGKTLRPRRTTYERIRILAETIRDAFGVDAAAHLTHAMGVTTDEGLRFMLWDVALDALRADRAQRALHLLAEPGQHYSADNGRTLLSVSEHMPTGVLIKGLDIRDSDTRRRAREAHPEDSDVTAHRHAIQEQQRQARAWQALSLIALACKRDDVARPLLGRWAEQADEDLADASRVALSMLGDASAADTLRRRADATGSAYLVDSLVALSRGENGHTSVRMAHAEERPNCDACGCKRDASEPMLLGGTTAVCNACIVELGQTLHDHRDENPESVCSMSGRRAFETKEMYRHGGLTLSSEVVEMGLGMLERAAVDHFLSR